MITRATLAVLILAGVAALAQDRGYRISGNQVVVDAREHWRNWSYPPGTLELTAPGEVRARRWRRQVNAVTDIVDYLRLNPPVALADRKPEEITVADAVQAGSRVERVPALFDGDPSTYWEPVPLEPGMDLASQWWLVVDLGRVVFADRIVLRFVEEELGDPFLLFDVLVSDGTRPARVRGAANPEYRTVLQTLQRNKTQRTFEIDLSALDPSIGGEGLRFVQVVVTGSDAEHGREVDLAAYEGLPAAERGAVEYYKRLGAGQEVAVRPEVFAQLDEQRRGAVRYFRRERPRLAELEVWSEGDELLAGTFERRGSVALPGGEDVNLRSFVDGDLVTDSNLIIGKVVQVADPERSLIFDLGSTFWVDTQRMAYGRGLYRGSMADYRLDFSDGTQAADGSIKWTRVVDRRQAQQSGVRFDGNSFAPIQARFFRLQYTLSAGGHQTANLAEIQLYGRGYQPRVELESDLIRLGASRNLLRLDWDAQTPPGTQVQIQTRTGDDLQEELHYFKKDGTEVSAEQYKKLLSIFKGEIVAREVEGSGWSDWSEAYTDPAGSPVTSPSPREFLKIRAVLVSADPEVRATLRRVRLHFADPVAQALVGEIDPVQTPQLARPQPFSLYLKPVFASADLGFDQLLLRVPADMALALEGFYAGKEADFAEPQLDRLRLAGVQQLPTGADSLLLSFPALGPRSGVELLRLDFRSALFATGAVVEAALQQAGAGAGQWQRVDAGDAYARVESNSLTLLGVVEHKQLIDQVEVRSPVFTPNGDGINDAVEFGFSVVLLGDNSPVVVAIHDLAGNLVRRLESVGNTTGTGHRRIAWDGRDHQGRLLPPGTYLARLALEADTRGAKVSRSSVVRRVALIY
ncbi:MAG: hypothetical protein FJY95_01570 [Candidatus Handelsmanbacteria bacterium]|nr:hypothetical protein [Candidatus Handelsmanbacteria bacterium]